MQRRILILTTVLVLGIVALAGAWRLYRNYKETRPQPMWVELSLRESPTAENEEKFLAEMTARFTDPAVTEKIAADFALARRWHLPDDKTAGEELARRTFVRLGHISNHPMGGTVPALHVGVNGIARDQEISGKIVEAYAREILGEPNPSAR